MEFGKISAEELSTVDTSLPPDHRETRALLNRYKGAGPTSVHVGCAKWGRKDWIGKIYPTGTKEADFLERYGEHFNAIELNATFYRIPSKKQTEAWSSKVGDDFRFCPKVSQSISHIRRLKEVEEAVDRFLNGISGFGKKLGAVFLMPHPSMGPKSLETIDAFLEMLPKDLRVFVELRHRQWFSEAESTQKFLDVFAKHGAGTVITDALGRRDCLHMHLTLPEAFVRFVGNGLHETDYSRVDAWVQRLREWMENGLQKVYFFMHQQDEVHSPELTKYVIEQLNRHCGTQIRLPQFVA